MKLLDILTSPWAIVPEKLIEIQNIYFTHLRGEYIDIKAIEAQLGKPLENKKKNYEIREEVALISIEGILAKRANMFTQISGGTSMQLLEKDIDQAMEDPDVKVLLFYIDSPGGTVDGTQELANHIHSLRGRKPMVSFAESLMGSAAYWIGSAANEIVMSGDTTQVGSIGVVATHTDVSKAEEKEGYKTTEIVAGKYKRIASQYAPLTEEGKAMIQDIVDHVYSIFIRDVAKNRNVSEEKVVKDMADGRIFLGRKAIDAGLVDRMETLDQTIGRLNRREILRMMTEDKFRMIQEAKQEGKEHAI